MSYVPFQNADIICGRFIALLEKHGIHSPIGSALEDELLSLPKLLEIVKNPSIASGKDEAAILRSAAGIHDLAAKVLSIECLAEFSEFLPHLKLIGENKIPTASLIQNAQSASSDDTSRKIAELYLGCLAAHVGDQVRLDSPTAAKGDNPDVIFRATPCDGTAPRKWALAIKTISSTQGQTIFDRIAEGAKQIDRPECKADVGMVVINAKSALKHNALWDANFQSLQEAIDALKAQLCDLIAAAEKDREQSEWDQLFTGKVVRPILFMGQTLVHLATSAGDKTPTSVKMLAPYDANGLVDPQAHGLSYMMTHFMQTVLLGNPGGEGYLPS